MTQTSKNTTTKKTNMPKKNKILYFPKNKEKNFLTKNKTQQKKSLTKSTQKKPNLTGEKKLEEILRRNNIKFERDKKLVLLKDTKKYRVPDFFLPEYKLVIEYFGSWYNKSKAIEKKERARFMEKVGAYNESGVSSLLLYPEDLDRAEEIILTEISKLEAVGKVKEIAKTIKTKEITEKHLHPIEREVIVRRKEVNIVYDRGKVLLLKNIIMALASISILLFLAQAIIGFVLFLQGNPLSNDLTFLNDILYLAFIAIIPIGIILSGLFAYMKRLSKGFIYVTIILILFYALILFLFGDPLNRAIVILLSILAIIPAEYYMVSSN
jgi:very-short-patch-repair endonuclease